MINLALSLLTTRIGKIVSAGVLLMIGAGLIYYRGYTEGKRSVEIAQITKTVEVYRATKKNNDSVNRLPDGAAARILRTDWQR
jgi:hypothetical protein